MASGAFFLYTPVRCHFGKPTAQFLVPQIRMILALIYIAEALHKESQERSCQVNLKVCLNPQPSTHEVFHKSSCEHISEI